MDANLIRRCVREMTAYIPGDSAEDDRIVKLNQNESRYPPSPRAIKAIQDASSKLYLYPESTSINLRRAASEVYGVALERILAGNGSDELLRLLFHCCCEPGDVAAAFYPSYTYYSTLAAMHDVRYRLIDFEGEYGIPKALDLSGVRLVFLPNPNGPTGTVFPEGEIRRLIESVRDGFVVVDEAYADFSGQTSLPLLGEYANLVVVRTFSKSYGLAGLRAGLCFGNEELLCQMEKVRDFYNVDRLAQAGAEAALRDQDWVSYICGQVVGTRERLAGSLRGLGLRVHESGANFLLVRFGVARRAEGVFEELRRRGILVRYFKNRGLEDAIRVSIGTETDMEVFRKELEDILERMG